MLRSCSFPDCETLTMSPYCFEHEQLIVGQDGDHRVHTVAFDEPMARELAEVVVDPAPLA